MYTLIINDTKMECENMFQVKKKAVETTLNFLLEDTPVKISQLNGEHFEFFMTFGSIPYYKDENAFRNTSFHKALSESLLFIQFQFHDDRGEWFRKRFQKLQKGLSLIQEALEF